MAAKVYVGNLSWSSTDETLRNAFSDVGQVVDSIVMRDRETGRSRGFGFVTFGSAEEAERAINMMNEQELDGRKIRVNMANAKPTNAGGGGGGGGYRYGSNSSSYPPQDNGYGGGRSYNTGYTGGGHYSSYGSYPPSQGGSATNFDSSYPAYGATPNAGQGPYGAGGYPTGGYPASGNYQSYGGNQDYNNNNPSNY